MKKKSAPAPVLRRVADAHAAYWAMNTLDKPYRAYTSKEFNRDPRTILDACGQLARVRAADGGWMWAFETESARAKFIKLYGGELV